MARTGRPSEYDETLHERLPEMFANGESVAEVCREIGISKTTFHYWMKQHDELAKAYEEGKFVSESWWMKLGRAGAAGAADINPSVWIFNMKNRFNWGDRTKNEHTGKDGEPLFKGIILERVTDGETAERLRRQFPGSHFRR